MQISITVELIIKAVAKVMGGYFALETGKTPFAVRAVIKCTKDVWVWKNGSFVMHILNSRRCV